MQREKGRNSYKKKVFGYFIAIAIVPLLILGIYAYYSSISALRRSINQSNETALVSVENRTEAVLNQIRQNFLRIAARKETERIAEMSYQDIPYKEMQDFIDGIVSEEAYINYIKSYAFISFKEGWVLSNKGLAELGEIKNAKWLHSIQESSEKMFWINQMEQKEFPVMTEKERMLPEYVSQEYMTLVVKVPVYRSSVEGAFVVNLRQDAMEQLFKGSLGNGNLTVLDQNGGLVYADSAALADYVQHHLAELKGQKEANVESRTYDLVSRKAPISGWAFVAGGDFYAAGNGLERIIFTMAGLTGLILAVTCFLGFLGSRRICRPIEALAEHVTGLVPRVGREKEDNFGLIGRGIQILADSNNELSQMIERQKTQLTELFALRLIRGRLSQEEINHALERLKICPQKCYCVASVMFCAESSAEKLKCGGLMGGGGNKPEALAEDALNVELLKRLPREIEVMLLFPPFIYSRAIVMVLDAAEKEKLDEKVLALRNCLSIFSREVYGGYINMGVSRSAVSLATFRGAYHESLEALKFNEYSNRDEDTEGISMEESSVTYYSDLMGHVQERPVYNLVLEDSVREAVDSGNREKAFAALEEFLREVGRTKVVPCERQYYLNRFLLAVLSVPEAAGISVADLFQEGGDLFVQLNQIYDVHEMRRFFEMQVIVPVIQRMNELRKTSSQIVLEKIFELVKENEGDLTLSECAQRLGYHPSYIWRILKITKNITFTDYIASQKLEMAKKLLLDSSLSVAEIAERLSYSNAQNFIRLFKKHMGITPGQYRKSGGRME